jgi:hypothetical protein
MWILVADHKLDLNEEQVVLICGSLDKHSIEQEKKLYEDDYQAYCSDTTDEPIIPNRLKRFHHEYYSGLGYGLNFRVEEITEV